MAELSGLPPAKREGWLLMVLQAAIDDSGNEPNVPAYVLAGFIAPATAWAEFSGQWYDALGPTDKTPRLEYFKAKEAFGLRDQFDPSNGWTERLRDQLVARLIQIICDYAKFSLWVSMEHTHFAQHIRSLHFPERTLLTDNPYLTLTFNVAHVIAAAAPPAGLTDRCDLYFDNQQGQQEELPRWWPTIQRFMDDMAKGWGEQPIIRNMPSFRSDTEFLPLQAADLYAWIIRRALVQKTGALPISEESGAALMAMSGTAFRMKEEHVKAFRDVLVANQARYIRDNPAVRVHGYDDKSAARIRKRAREDLAAGGAVEAKKKKLEKKKRKKEEAKRKKHEEKNG